MKFKRILCGVDFSQASVIAFDTAIELARALQAELHILHVIEAYPVVPEWSPIHSVEDATILLEEKATTAMEALVATAASALDGIKMTTEITRGEAFVEIVNRARDRESNLIVLGANGLPLPEEAFSGNTAEQVFKEAACSVLIARD